MGKITTYLFRGLDLSNLVVHRGELFITEGGHTRHYSEIDLKASLSLLNWGNRSKKPRSTSPTWESPRPRAGSNWRAG